MPPICTLLLPTRAGNGLHKWNKGSAAHQMASCKSPATCARGIVKGQNSLSYRSTTDRFIFLVLSRTILASNHPYIGVAEVKLSKVESSAREVLRPIRRTGHTLVGIHVRRTDYIKKVSTARPWDLWTLEKFVTFLTIEKSSMPNKTHNEEWHGTAEAIFQGFV